MQSYSGTHGWAGLHERSPPDVVLADVAAVDQNFTRLNVVKSLNEQYYGALAAAAGPHKRYALLRLDDQIEIIQNEGFRPRGIREAHVLELNSTLKRRRAVAAGDEAIV